MFFWVRVTKKVGLKNMENHTRTLQGVPSEALESVAALLTALGSSCDRPEWPQHVALRLGGLPLVFKPEEMREKHSKSPTKTYKNNIKFCNCI